MHVKVEALSIPVSSTTATDTRRNKVVWFRDHCLRVQDNEALTKAVKDALSSNGDRAGTDDISASPSIVPVFLWKGYNSNSPVDTATGGTAKDVFVSYALQSLNASLHGKLNIGQLDNGNSDSMESSIVIADELASICTRVNADTIYYPLSHSKNAEDRLKSELEARGLTVRAFTNSYSLLDYAHDDTVSVPWKDIILQHPFRSPLIPFVDWLLQELKDDCRSPEVPLTKPERLDEVLLASAESHAGHLISSKHVMSSPITADELSAATGTTQGGTAWGTSITKAWPATENDAVKNLNSFLASIKDVKDGNGDEDSASTLSASSLSSLPAKRTHLASRLSPYLARGILSARQVYTALRLQLDDSVATSFVRRLCWRDYTYAATALFPDIEQGCPVRDAYYGDGNGRNSFHNTDDKETKRRLELWKRGETGFPLVDAGMRQLIMDGWMPQKVRLAVSSALVEGMDVPYESGMQHFEEFLVDYDPSINTNMWQNAGAVGFDPYYVGMRYKKRPYWDADGSYVRTWVPELSQLPDYAERPEAQRGTGKFRVDCLYEPWTAPLTVLEDSGIELGTIYPHRACDERESRSAFFGRLRMKRKKWDPHLLDQRGLDSIRLGRDGERIGVFTPKALLDKRQFRKP